MSVARNLFLGREPLEPGAPDRLHRHAPRRADPAGPLRRGRRRPQTPARVRHRRAADGGRRPRRVHRRAGRDHGRADVVPRAPRGRPARRGDRAAALGRRRRPVRHAQAGRGLPALPGRHGPARRPQGVRRRGRRHRPARSRRHDARPQGRGRPGARPDQLRRRRDHHAGRLRRPGAPCRRPEPARRAGPRDRGGAPRGGGGPGRPARLRPDRDRPGHVRRGPRGQRRGRRWTARRRVAAGHRARAIAAGVGFVSEDRKAEGIVPDLSVRDNIVLAALPRLARAGFVSRQPVRRRRRHVRPAAADQDLRPGAARPRAVRRQPAEGAARPDALPQPAGAPAGRAHPRASTSAPRPRSRPSSTSWPATGSAWC